MPRFVRFISTAALVLLIASGCRQEPPSVSHEAGRPSAAAVDSLTRDVRERYAIPAVAAVVVRSDSILAVSAAGVRHRGRSAAVSVRDQFHLGSNAKAMTATLIALLVEEGTLSWETTPAEVFSGLSDAIDPALRDVTIEQLLAHRAGIQPFTNTQEYEALPPLDDDPKARRAAFSRFLLQGEPAHRPDSAFVYSNAGYAVAAAMAEQVRDVSLEQMMRQRLFEPLDIDGGFGWPVAVDSSQPWGHRTRGGDTLQVHVPKGGYSRGLGPLWTAAGDVHMNMPDYGRFLQLHLRGLRGEATRLLSASTIRDMHASRGRMTDDAEGPGYGLGWVVHEFLGARSSSHAGSIGTFKARATVQASRDLAVAVVANAGHDAADEATIELRKALLERYRGEPKPRAAK
jgi:CubicO group peptidase (beta-lactamase class C family)